MVMENSSSEIHCVFVETNMDTRLVVMLNKEENVSVFKEKLSKEHSQCFPELVFLFVDAAVIVDNGKLIAAAGSNLNPDELLENKTQVLQAEAAEEKIARKRKWKSRRKKSSHKSLKLCEKVEVEVGPESGVVGNDIEKGDKDLVNIGESQQTCPNSDEVLEKKAEAEETWEAAEEKTKKRKVKSSDATESGAIAKDTESLEEDGTSIGLDQKTSEVEMLVIEDSVE